MKWEDFRGSDNIEDYRGSGGGGGGGRGVGIGMMLVLGLVGMFLGVDPRILIAGAGMLQGGGQTTSGPVKTGDPTDQEGKFVSRVLAQTEDVWKEVLPAQKGIRYVQPKLALFSGSTRSACGAAEAAMGPFYCPLDQKVYLDTSFFREMQNKLGGGGDFAYAYVIAHEIGHHVENVLGILPKVQQAQQNADQRQANALSVRVELMADCLAGVWAHHADKKWNILQQGDLEEAMRTATAIGDDRLQKAGRGYVVPDSFTHGSSAQRVEWLRRGLQSGQIDDCNTFRRNS
jgi:hypothetical protein